jgi:hypothetical protein
MHFTYGFCDGNSLAALRGYRCQYSDWRQIHRIDARETGTLMSHACADRGKRHVRVEEDVLDVAHDNPNQQSASFSCNRTTFSECTMAHSA